MESVTFVSGTHPFPRRGYSALVVKHKCYFFGGFSSYDNNPRVCADVPVLDLLKNRWLDSCVLPLPPKSLDGHSATLVGNRLYLIGGGYNSASSGFKFDCTDELYVLDLDPLTNNSKKSRTGSNSILDKMKWNQITVCSGPPILVPEKVKCLLHNCYCPRNSQIFRNRAWHATLALDSKIFVMAGRRMDLTYFMDVFVFDTKTHIFHYFETCSQTKQDYPTPRASNGIFSPDDRHIYIFGGRYKLNSAYGSNPTHEHYNDIFILDTITHVWRRLSAGQKTATTVDNNLDKSNHRDDGHNNNHVIHHLQDHNHADENFGSAPIEKKNTFHLPCSIHKLYQKYETTTRRDQMPFYIKDLFRLQKSDPSPCQNNKSPSPRTCFCFFQNPEYPFKAYLVGGYMSYDRNFYYFADSFELDLFTLKWSEIEPISGYIPPVSINGLVQDGNRIVLFSGEGIDQACKIASFTDQNYINSTRVIKLADVSPLNRLWASPLAQHFYQLYHNDQNADMVIVTLENTYNLHQAIVRARAPKLLDYWKRNFEKCNNPPVIDWNSMAIADLLDIVNLPISSTLFDRVVSAYFEFLYCDIVIGIDIFDANSWLQLFYMAMITQIKGKLAPIALEKLASFIDPWYPSKMPEYILKEVLEISRVYHLQSVVEFCTLALEFCLDPQNKNLRFFELENISSKLINDYPSLSECMDQLYLDTHREGDSADDGDFTFNFDDGDSTKVFSCIIKARSHYFANMLYGGFSESEKKSARIINMKKTKFLQLVRYLYSGNCAHIQDVDAILSILINSDLFFLTQETRLGASPESTRLLKKSPIWWCPIHKNATKNPHADLLNHCINTILTNSNEENASHILKMSQMHNLTKLEKKLKKIYPRLNLHFDI